MVRLTVLDDGSGFDAANCPGVSSGHFGLQGIRERINQFDGEMSIASTPGAGTRVTVTLKLAAPAHSKPPHSTDSRTDRR